MSEETKGQESENTENNLDLSKELGSEEKQETETPKAQENTEEEKQVTWAEMDKLKKFNGDVDKLAKSYVELETKLSSRKPAKDMTDEELVEFNKQFYGDLSTAKSIHEGDLAEISEKAAEELGISTKMADAISAKVHKSMATNLAKSRISKANEVMTDPEARRAVINAVKAKGSDYANDFQTRLTTGQVSVQELELLQDTGKTFVEAELGLEGEVDNDTFESAEAELIDITNNQAHIWTNESHPDFMRVTQKIAKLKRKLGI